MSEEYGSDFVVISDEDGNDIELEHLDTIEHEGQTYMAFIPADTGEDEEEIDFFILRLEEDEEGEEVLATVDDEAELDKIYAMFMKRMEEFDENDPE
jgi:uncharacterized protein YrzB (UPF0473 family)